MQVVTVIYQHVSIYHFLGLTTLDVQNQLRLAVLVDVFYILCPCNFLRVPITPGGVIVYRVL